MVEPGKCLESQKSADLEEGLVLVESGYLGLAQTQEQTLEDNEEDE